ncbi:hypothetical protein G9P44_000457 [Scheffersomyces stipitis]|nr:hypothetical protein G9P44_000457 [Scheffersomyces stipitis]
MTTTENHTDKQSMFSRLRLEFFKSFSSVSLCTNNSLSGSFDSILANLFAVYTEADKETQLLREETLPSDFFEADANQILSSYESFIKNNKSSTTSISSKYANGEYANSPFKLYHDVKIVSSIQISKYKVGSKKYSDIDFFYKFATELLLRELHRLHISLQAPVPENEDDDEVLTTDLESHLKDDFEKISRTYTLSNGEVINYSSKTQEPDPAPSISPYANVYNQPQPQPPKQTTQPLFSSLIPKSNLDRKPTIVQYPYTIAKVVPLLKDQSRNTSTLDSLSVPNQKIPSPLDQKPSDLLHDFFHPIWYTLPVPTWLNYHANVIKPANVLPQQAQAISMQSSSSQSNKPKLTVLQQRGTDSEPLSAVPTLVRAPGDSYRTFAPSLDSRDAIISEEFKGKVWLNHIGFEEIEKIKNSYLQSIEPTKPSTVPSTKEEETTKEAVASEKESSAVEEVPIESSNEDSEIGVINIAHIVSWDPEKIEEFKTIKKEKESIVKAKSIQRLISTNILKLNKLRQERYLRSDSRNTSPTTSEEIRIYNTTMKLISLAIQIQKVSPGDFSLEFSKKLPVLVTEFNGVMPGIPPSRLGVGTSGASKSTRLPSIRGPYKKKNRI